MEEPWELGVERTHQLPPQAHSPHGSRGLRHWGQDSGSGHFPAILSPARPAALPEGGVGRAMQAPSAPDTKGIQERDVLPEGFQPWLSSCSFPWGVVWSSRSRYQLDPTWSFLLNSLLDPPQVDSPDISLQVPRVQERGFWSSSHPQMLFAHSWGSLPGQ